MSYLIRRAFRYAARKVAADPRVREKAGEYARLAAAEVKTIAREENRAYAAGRAVRRFLDRAQAERRDGPDRDDNTPA